MLQLLGRKTMSTVGVEFGSCSLRAVQLVNQEGSWHVHHWVNLEVEPTSPEVTPPHTPADVRLAFGAGTFSGRRLAMILSPPDVEYQLLDVPAAVLDQPRDQLRTALQIELDRQMPWPIAESEIAAWPVKPQATGKVPAMIVAARRSVIETRLEPFDALRIGCHRADIVPNAMIRLQQGPDGSRSADENLLWGVLDLGFQSSRLYLILAQRPVYTRVLRQGGRDLTTALAEGLRVDFPVAERYKRLYGVRATERGVRSMLGGLSRITEEELPGVLYAIMRPIIETLVREIERSYRFVMGQWPGVQAGPIQLIGGGARLGGLVDVLSAQLGVPVGRPDAAAVTGSDVPAGPGGHPLWKPDQYCVLAPCVGLAMNEELA